MDGPALVAPCGTMTLRIEGALDARAAAQALERIADLACRDVVLDVHRAWEVSDVALAFLAGGVSRLPGSRVVVRGLRPQHARLLEELGAGSLMDDGTGHARPS